MVPIVTREATKDVTLQGKYFVPAGKSLLLASPPLLHSPCAHDHPSTYLPTLPTGTRMMILIQGVHHRGDIWPEPEAYQPDRFLQIPEPFTFLPFIEGPRNCLGQHLALLEAKIVLATLVQRFEFEFESAEGEKTAGKKHPSMVPVIPDDPGLMVLVR